MGWSISNVDKTECVLSFVYSKALMCKLIIRFNSGLSMRLIMYWMFITRSRYRDVALPMQNWLQPNTMTMVNKQLLQLLWCKWWGTSWLWLQAEGNKVRADVSSACIHWLVFPYNVFVLTLLSIYHSKLSTPHCPSIVPITTKVIRKSLCIHNLTSVLNV